VITVSIDGVLVAPDQASISVFDRGLLYGDGLFEVLRTWHGVAVDLDAHLDRLYGSARVLELRVLERERMVEAVTAAIAAADYERARPGGAERAERDGDHRIRIVVTRGPGPLAAPLGTLGPGRTIVIVEALPPQPSELALAVVDWPLPRRAGPAHKTLAYLDHVIARELAAAAGADEAIRLDHAGDVVECATANVFAVIRGVVTTPAVDAGVLPGVTRARVLALCDRLGIASVARRLPLAELRGADEVFVTSALRGVVPITRLDGVPRAAGPITATIAAEYVRLSRGLAP
jgi:branched-chain amino acid aminotransferase